MRSATDRAPAQTIRSERFANAALDTRIGSLDPEIQRLKHLEIERRYERKDKAQRFWTWQRWRKRRLNEIILLLLFRYDSILPVGDYVAVRIVLFHMASIIRNTANKMRAWIAEAAPWLDEDEADRLIRAAIASEANLPKPDTLARYLDLTAAVRHALGIRTIGAADITKRQRTKARKARKRIAGTVAACAKRLAAGAQPRAEYLATHTASRDQPWIALGISRATYYRRRKAGETSAGETGVSDNNTPKAYMRRRTCVTVPAAPPIPIDAILPKALAARPGDGLAAMPRPLRPSMLGHQRHCRWLGGEVNLGGEASPVRLNDNTVCSIWRLSRLAAGDHAPVGRRIVLRAVS
jgi:hypothetical protein